MSADPATPATPPAPTEAAPQTPKVYGEDHVKALREEAKQHRLEAEAAKAKIAEIEKAKAAAEQATLAEQGKWKELAEAREREAAEAKAKASKADEYAQELEAIKAQHLADLPEDLRPLVADLSPSKAIALAKKLQAKNAGPAAAPPVNGGAPGGPKAPAKLFNELSPAEQRAALAGKTPDEIRALTGVSARRGIW